MRLFRAFPRILRIWQENDRNSSLAANIYICVAAIWRSYIGLIVFIARPTSSSPLVAHGAHNCFPRIRVEHEKLHLSHARRENKRRAIEKQIVFAVKLRAL